MSKEADERGITQEEKMRVCSVLKYFFEMVANGGERANMEESRVAVLERIIAVIERAIGDMTIDGGATPWGII